MNLFSLLLAAVAIVGPYRKAPYVGAISLDADEGRVLFEDKADQKAFPASVTKLMTALLVLEDIAAGKLALNDVIVVPPEKNKSDKHFRQASCTGLEVGSSMTVEEMLKSLMVNSANDAALFLAERCSGSVPLFVERMNAKAGELGMTATKYYNPNGLPPPPFEKVRNFNYSTCRDQAKLACALLKEHPEILAYTSLKTWDVTSLGRPFCDRKSGEQIRWVNHNNVMVKNKLKVINPDGSEAVDGLKTGYIDAGGSSVVLTGKRGKKRVVTVVLGSASSALRDDNASRLLADALDALVW